MSRHCLNIDCLDTPGRFFSIGFNVVSPAPGSGDILCLPPHVGHLTPSDHCSSDNIVCETLKRAGRCLGNDRNKLERLMQRME